jgi:NAD-dependent DNA ligase
VTTPQLPLTDMEFLIHKTSNKKNNELKKQIESLGGQVIKSVTNTTAAVISTTGGYFYLQI